MLLGLREYPGCTVQKKQKKAWFKPRKDTVLSTGYFMFLGTVQASVCFDKQLIDFTFFKTNDIWRWQHERLGPFSKTFKTNLGFKFLHMELTYKLFICLFSPDVLGTLVSNTHTHTANKVQSIVISPGRSAPKSHQAVSVARKWSFKVTAVSQMSSKRLGKNWSPFNLPHPGLQHLLTNTLNRKIIQGVNVSGFTHEGSH